MDRKDAFAPRDSLAFALSLFVLLMATDRPAAACGWAGDGEARAAAEAEVVVVGRDGRPLSDDERTETPSPVSAAPKTERSSRPTERGGRHIGRSEREVDGAGVAQDADAE